MPELVVLRKAVYLRKRLLLKGVPVTVVKSAGLVVKKVAEVPSGPTKLNGPPELVLAAAWNFRVVFVGVAPVHDRVVQFGV